MIKKLLLPTLLLTVVSSIAQCVSPQNRIAFNFDGKTYEIIKENKTWIAAAECAVSQGGKLAEINSAEENQAIFNALQNADIDVLETDAPDGFSSYVWLGGNDISREGSWMWNGGNTDSSLQFWRGNASGNAVGGLYNNWGNEPDNWGSGSGQDGLGMAIINWPLGLAGQWNDVNHNNSLYFVIEYGAILGTTDTKIKSKIALCPNPAVNTVKVLNTNAAAKAVTIFNATGQQIMNVTQNNINDGEINVAALPAGIYMVNILFTDGTLATQKLVRE